MGPASLTFGCGDSLSNGMMTVSLRIGNKAIRAPVTGTNVTVEAHWDFWGQFWNCVSPHGTIGHEHSLLEHETEELPHTKEKAKLHRVAGLVLFKFFV